MLALRVTIEAAVLRILVSYPDGFALMEDLKRDMAILATSGRDWAERTKASGRARAGPEHLLAGLIERVHGGWRTQKGRSVLEFMEAKTVPADTHLSMRAPHSPAESDHSWSAGHRCGQAPTDGKAARQPRVMCARFCKS